MPDSSVSVLDAASIDQSPAPPSPLFSHEQLESHALMLAAAHTLAADPRRGVPLLPRLDKCAAILEEAYQFLSRIARNLSRGALPIMTGC